MKRLSAIILLFTIAFAIFFIGPPLLGKPLDPYPLMNVADVFDILTPWVLLPLYWLLYRKSQPGPVSMSGIIVLVMLIFGGPFIVVGTVACHAPRPIQASGPDSRQKRDADRFLGDVPRTLKGKSFLTRKQPLPPPPRSMVADRLGRCAVLAVG